MREWKKEKGDKHQATIANMIVNLIVVFHTIKLMHSIAIKMQVDSHVTNDQWHFHFSSLCPFFDKLKWTVRLTVIITVSIADLINYLWISRLNSNRFNIQWQTTMTTLLLFQCIFETIGIVGEMKRKRWWLRFDRHHYLLELQWTCLFWLTQHFFFFHMLQNWMSIITHVYALGKYIDILERKWFFNAILSSVF